MVAPKLGHALREQFGRDIARFKELKRIETEYARSVQR